jgi:hypothetical protein
MKARGPRRRRGSGAGAAAVIAATVALAGCGGGANLKSGALPNWIPKSTVQPDGVLTGTRLRPALTSEGDAVRAHIGGTTVLATVTGPEVPGEGLPYQARATTCTWTVTLSNASGPVRISRRDFSSLDHLGTIYHPTFVAGQPRPATTLEPGRRVSFELRAVMRTGEGLMRWSPGGRHIVAEWDFEVEVD